MISEKQLKELLRYEPETGQFYWLVDRRPRISAGDKAGSVSSKGYIRIYIMGKNYLAHRLAFLYMDGSFPLEQVDHINRTKGDNRWVNLRHATQRENHENRKDNADFIGVSRHKKSGQWQVRSPQANGRRVFLGLFNTHIAACYCRHAFNVSSEVENE